MKATYSVASGGIVHELLTKYNYQRWRPVIQKYLEGKGLWEVVQSDHIFQLPRGRDILETAENSSNHLSSQNGRELKATHDIEQGLGSVSVDEIEASWKMKDAKALHIILLSCGPEILGETSHFETAKSAWDYLRKQYGELKTKQYIEQAIMGGSNLDSRHEDLFKDAERGYYIGFLINSDSDVLRITTASGRTILHVAVIGGNLGNVEKLVKVGGEELIGMQDRSGYTALALAARYSGSTDIARCLIESGNSTRETLLTMEDKEGDIPVLLAAAHLHKEMTTYLYSKTPQKVFDDKEDSRVLLLARCITAQIFGVALKLLIRYPNLPRESLSLSRFSFGDLLNESMGKFSNKNQLGVEGKFSIMAALAKMPYAFPSGGQFGLRKQFIYDFLNVEREFMDNYKISDDILPIDAFVSIVTHVAYGSPRKSSYPSCWFVRVIGILVLNFLFLPAQLLGLLLRVIARLFIQIFNWLNIFGIREIYDQKYAHYEVLAVLYYFAHSVAEYDDLQLRHALAYEAMLHAAQNGIVEFINAMMEASPKLLSAVDSERRDIVTYAILNRKQNVFQALIDELDIGFSGLQNNILRYSTDAFDNNLLHAASHLGPTSSTSGAALQMQREIQWFKAVEEVVHPLCKIAKNADGKKPHELFTENHEQLMKAGEKWAKEMASSFTVVGTLITTMMFAAAFTVPGGNNQVTGLPIFLHDKIFTAFLIADVASLFASATSVIIFIGILTSRFAEKDFLSSLPRKLLSGILLLIISVGSMVIAFCAAHAIILKGSGSYNWFVVGPILLSLASIPITALVISQVHLMYDILRSTWKNPISSINTRGFSSKIIPIAEFPTCVMVMIYKCRWRLRRLRYIIWSGESY